MSNPVDNLGHPATIRGELSGIGLIFLLLRPVTCFLKFRPTNITHSILFIPELIIREKLLLQHLNYLPQILFEGGK